MALMAITAVLEHRASGQWWSRSYLLSLLVPLTIMPLAVWVMFVPQGIEWSEARCEIHTRIRGPFSFSWDDLIGFGHGRGVFLLKFEGAPRFQISPDAFDRAQWKEFQAFIETHDEEKRRGTWKRPWQSWR